MVVGGELEYAALYHSISPVAFNLMTTTDDPVGVTVTPSRIKEEEKKNPSK